jgi:hypothetical protein
MLLAHGIGGRADLPLPLSLVAYSAGSVLVLSFAALAWLWPRPRWERGIAGRPMPDALQTALRVAAWPLRIASVLLLGVATYAAFNGPRDPLRNIAPSYLYAIVWVGFLFASGAIGDVWRAIGPIPAIARAFPQRQRAYTFGHWPAAAGLLAFTWLELVHPNAADPRVVGRALVVYLVLTIVGLGLWGGTWAREGDPFGALFGLVASMAPFYADEEGGLHIRPPLVGLATLRPRPGTVALVIVALGSTTYDGLARTRFWTELVGDAGLLISTAGLLWTIGAVYALYRLAVSLMPVLAGVPVDERDPDETADLFVHSLVPIALAYAIAHYFSLLVFEGQTFIARLSDPAGGGQNLFGTAGWSISYSALGANAIAYVQVGAIVLGHVSAVILAHDRAVSRYPSKVATRTQYPMLAVMVAYTVGALVILLGG